MISGIVTALVLMAAPTVRMHDDRGRPWSIELRTGFDRALVPLSLGVATRVDVARRPLVLGATWTLPMLRPDLSDQRGDVYAEIDINPRLGWMVRVANTWSIVGTRNSMFTAVGLATRVGATAGWSTRRFAIGGELNLGVTWVTGVWASKSAREDGGVAFRHASLAVPAWALQAGVRTGVLLGRVELALRAGFDRLGRYNLAIPPVYATLGVAVRFGSDEVRRARSRRRAASR